MFAPEMLTGDVPVRGTVSRTSAERVDLEIIHSPIVVETKMEGTPAAGPCQIARGASHTVKRGIDIAGALVGLLMTLPIALIVAAAVKLTSRGPVLFVHERVGRGGEVFRLYKFRSMQHGTHDEVLACPDEHQRYAENDFKLAEDDHRITRFGQFLRSTSLDELPQFVNILKGEMSLVGVRPLVPLELAGRPSEHQSSYVQMRPGLTGLWQVAGRSSVDPFSRRALDQEYVDTWSNLNDLKIMLRTPATVLRFHQAQ